MDDNALSLLSAVGASSPSGPAAIAPATDNGTVQAMLKAYGLPAPVGAPSDDLLTGNGSTSNSSLYGPLSPNQSQANVSPSTSPAQTLPVTPSGAPQTSSTTTSDTTGAEPFDPVASAQKHRAAADVIFGVKDEATRYASVLGYNYPSSIWYRKSYDILLKNPNNRNTSKFKNFFKHM